MGVLRVDGIVFRQRHNLFIAKPRCDRVVCTRKKMTSYFMLFASAGAHGMISSDPTVNPLMYNWNKVRITARDDACMQL